MTVPLRPAPLEPVLFEPIRAAVTKLAYAQPTLIGASALRAHGVNLHLRTQDADFLLRVDTEQLHQVKVELGAPSEVTVAMSYRGAYFEDDRLWSSGVPAGLEHRLKPTWLLGQDIAKLASEHTAEVYRVCDRVEMARLVSSLSPRQRENLSGQAFLDALREGFESGLR